VCGEIRECTRPVGLEAWGWFPVVGRRAAGVPIRGSKPAQCQTERRRGIVITGLADLLAPDGCGGYDCIEIRLRDAGGIGMARFALLLSGTMLVIAILGMPLRAQYYPPGYHPPPPANALPPCQAVTSGPFRGAARGAAGGALFGAIGGNAGKGAAIGAAVGGVAGAVRRGSARASGACY
jgi:hypothetical protein